MISSSEDFFEKIASRVLGTKPYCSFYFKLPNIVKVLPEPVGP